MAELTIEEKAKAYDEAIRKAKDMLFYKETRQEDIEYLFPELKESSEDDRIRKNTISIIRDAMVGNVMPLPVSIYQESIVWLEKQNEKKTTDKKQGKKKDLIDIPFGTDSEMIEETITIPSGYYAMLEGNKIHIKFLGRG